MSVVVPVYGNADTVEELATRVSTVLSALPASYDVLFVDDASRDDSSAVLDRMGGRDSRIKVLHLPRNVGQHPAALLGLARATGDQVVIMDADLQDRPEDIPRLLDADATAAAVFAGRRGQYESRARLVTSRLFKRVLSVATGIPPDAGMFVALRRPMVDRLLTMRGGAPFVPAMIGATRLRSISIPVERVPRPSGESSYSTAGRIRAALRAFRWVAAWRLGRLSFDRRGDSNVMHLGTRSREERS